jgi:uncharacterized protein YbjT (DUF2867 family)
MRTVAVTGATGFVGSETLDQLVAAGFTVRALARRPQAERARVAWVAGSLDDTAALDTLVMGADVVLHIAGVVNAPNRAGFEAGNGTGTANVIAAMQRAGLKRLIHVSSFAARNPDLSDYCWSKALAEEKVKASGLDWTMVRPPAVYGPRDTEFIEVMKVARYGLMPVPPTGRASLIHVRDLARVLVSLCGEPGDAYVGATWEVDDGAPNGLSHIELAAAFGRAFATPCDPATTATASADALRTSRPSGARARRPSSLRTGCVICAIPIGSSNPRNAHPLAFGNRISRRTKAWRKSPPHYEPRYVTHSQVRS